MSAVGQSCKAGALLVLGAALAGCRHQAAAPLPAQAQAPTAAPAAAAPPAPITVVTPLPSIPPDAEPRKVQPAAPEPPPPTPAAETQKTRKRFRRSKPAVAAEAPPAPAQSAPASKDGAAVQAGSPAAAGEAAASPASVAGVVPSPPGTPGQSYNSTVVEEAAPSLGRLSTGSQESQPARSKMLAETQSLEARLTKLKQPATHEGVAVRLQVEVFLKRAREAVEESDLDGAQTLNTKARVLLSELETE